MGRNPTTLQLAPKILIRGLIRAYQLGISPYLGPSCRFVPSCSEYALQAFARHPLATATRLTAWRLCRCHPWGASGFDPVPLAAASRALTGFNGSQSTHVSKHSQHPQP